mgnify:CR=1 FL=1
MSETNDIAEIRRAVQALCAEFPGEYWRTKDTAREYPGEFVDALTKAGFLAALIGVPHASHEPDCTNAAQCPRKSSIEIGNHQAMVHICVKPVGEFAVSGCGPYATDDEGNSHPNSIKERGQTKVTALAKERKNQNC